MPIDLQRIIETAVKAAVEPPVQAAPIPPKAKKRRLSTGRAMLLGAGLATAGRLIVSHKGRDVLDRVQQRFADPGRLDREPEEAEEYEDEAFDPELDGVGEEELAAEDEEEEELAAEDEDEMDESTDEDHDPDGEENEGADGSMDAEPRRPPAQKRRQRRRA